MIEQLIKDVEDLLEWMPVCSVGSAGHTRRLRVEAGLQKLKIYEQERPKYAGAGGGDPKLNKFTGHERAAL